MPKQAARTSARKIKDKWRAKNWYSIVAPEMFNKASLGETPCDDPSKLVGRVTEVTVQDLTGDFSKMHIKLQFRVQDVAGTEARTQFVGHDMTSDYIRRLTRRKRTRTDGVFNVVTKDNWKLRVKPMAITDKRIQSSKQRIIRQIMEKVVSETASNSTSSEFVKFIVSGELSKNIAMACKPIQPLSRVEVRRSEVLALGETPVPPPEAEEKTVVAEGAVASSQPETKTREVPVEEEIPAEPVPEEIPRESESE